MSNPVSTRLGVNQFWYKHWYSDSDKALSAKQDTLFDTLITLYLQYGLTFQSNPFMHEYWYRKQSKAIRVVNQSRSNARFFRRFFYTNDTLAIEHSYLIRHKTPEYFPMRMWTFRYDNWVIISIHWFKPLKTKLAARKLLRSASYVGGLSRASAQSRRLKRLKLLLLYVWRTRTLDYQF